MTMTDQVLNNNTDKVNKSITLIASIREKIYGPTTFADDYWEHIENGGDPDVF